MKSLKLLLGSGVLVGSLFMTASALADGILLAPSALSPAARAKLESQVQADRVAHPDAFNALKNVKGHRPEVYRNYRNPIPTASRELRGLGAQGLLPMLEALALAQPTRGSLNDAEWDALAVGMLEAVGVLRDVRSRAVLSAAFESKARPEVIAAAARALGRLGGDPELALLTKHAKKSDPLFMAAIQGLGQMRRLESAKHLSALLASSTTDIESEAIGAAIGTLGSSWGWRSFGPKYAAQGLEVRKVCAQALAQGFVRTKGTARTSMADGLLMVEHPATVDMLKTVRPGSGAATTAVDTLIARVQTQSAKQRRR